MSALDSLRRRRGHRRSSGKMGGGAQVNVQKAWQTPVIQGHYRPHVIRRHAKKIAADHLNQGHPDPTS